MDDLLAYCGDPLVVFNVHLPTITRLSLSCQAIFIAISEAPTGSEEVRADVREDDRLANQRTD